MPPVTEARRSNGSVANGAARAGEGDAPKENRTPVPTLKVRGVGDGNRVSSRIQGHKTREETSRPCMTHGRFLPPNLYGNLVTAPLLSHLHPVVPQKRPRTRYGARLAWGPCPPGDWVLARAVTSCRDNTTRGPGHSYDATRGPRQEWPVLGVDRNSESSGAVEAKRPVEEPPHDGKRADLPCDREGTTVTRT